MSFEIVYTSARRGLKGGSKGFCTVAATKGIPPALQDKLESLSGYRQEYGTGATNPVIYSYLRFHVARETFYVLSRVADAGVDYSFRNNKIGHYLAFTEHDRPDAALGPIMLLTDPNFWIEDWGDREPEYLDPVRFPRARRSRTDSAWESAFGDAGWAGMLARTVEKGPVNVVIVVPPEANSLGLVQEAMQLVPEAYRWDVSFSTCFTRLTSGSECHWRFVPRGSEEAAKLNGRRGLKFIDPLSQSAQLDTRDPFVAAARDGTGTPLDFKVRSKRRRRLASDSKETKPEYEAFPFRSPDAFVHPDETSTPPDDDVDSPPHDSAYDDVGFADDYDDDFVPETSPAPSSSSADSGNGGFRRPVTQSQMRRRQRAEAARQNRLGTRPAPVQQRPARPQPVEDDEFEKPKTKKKSGLDQRKKIVLLVLGLLVASAGGYLVWEQSQAPEPWPVPSIPSYTAPDASTPPTTPPNPNPKTSVEQPVPPQNTQTQTANPPPAVPENTSPSNNDPGTQPVEDENIVAATDDNSPPGNPGSENPENPNPSPADANSTNPAAVSGTGVWAALQQRNGFVPLPPPTQFERQAWLPLRIPRDTELKLRLLGGDAVLPGKLEFALKPAAESDAQSTRNLAKKYRFAWVVEYGSSHVLKMNQRKEIAWLYHDRQNGLAFQWLRLQEPPADRDVLTCCALEMTIQEESQIAWLRRAPVLTSPAKLPFSGLKSNVVDFRLSRDPLPQTGVLHIELQVQGIEPVLKTLPAVPNDSAKLAIQYSDPSQVLPLQAGSEQPARIQLVRIPEEADVPEDSGDEKSKTRRKRRIPPDVAEIEFEIAAESGRLVARAFSYIAGRARYIQIASKTGPDKRKREEWLRQRSFFDHVRQCPVEYRVFCLLPVDDRVIEYTVIHTPGFSNPNNPSKNPPGNP